MFDPELLSSLVGRKGKPGEFECSNVVEILYESIGKTVHDLIPIDEPMPGAIVAFCTKGPELEDHIGVMISRTHLIHVTQGSVRINRLKSMMPFGKLAGFYRWKEQ